MSDTTRIRHALLVAAVAAFYYFASTALMNRLPYASIPLWWFQNLPGGRSAMVLWLQLMDVSATLIAAFPIAVFLCWKVHRLRYSTSLLAAGVTSIIVATQVFTYNDPTVHLSAHMQNLIFLNAVVEVTAFLFAPVVLVALISLLPSNYQLERTRS